MIKPGTIVEFCNFRAYNRLSGGVQWHCHHGLPNDYNHQQVPGELYLKVQTFSHFNVINYIN